MQIRSVSKSRREQQLSTNYTKLSNIIHTIQYQATRNNYLRAHKYQKPIYSKSTIKDTINVRLTIDISGRTSNALEQNKLLSFIITITKIYYRHRFFRGKDNRIKIHTLIISKYDRQKKQGSIA